MADEPEILEPQNESSSTASGPSRREPPTIDLKARASEASSDEQPASAAPDDEAASKAQPGDGRTGHIVIGALSGGITAAVVLAAIWSSGLLKDKAALAPPPAASAADITARLTRLEKISETPPQTNADKTDPVLPARVAALEQSSQTQRKAVAALRHQLETLSAAVAELKSAPANGRVAPSASAPQASAPMIDLSPLREKIAALETMLGKVDAKTDAVAARPAPQMPALPSTLPDVKLRTALVASLIANDVTSGQKLAPVISIAEKFDLPKDMIEKLKPFADQPLPDDAQLSRKLLQLLPQANAAASAPAPQNDASQNIWDRLKAHAASLVRIEEIGEGKQKEAAAPYAKVQAAARQNNVAEARAALEALPDGESAFAQGWLAEVRARDDARNAAQKLFTDAMAMISPDSGDNK